jgi:hypothetical protein
VTFRLTPPRVKVVENDIEKACLDLLRLRSYWPARLHAGTFKTIDGKRWIKGVEKGTPDYGAIHCVYPGFLLEVKRPGEGASIEQAAKHREIFLGYRLAICTVDSVESLVRWLDGHQESAKVEWARLLAAMPRAP